MKLPFFGDDPIHQFWTFVKANTHEFSDTSGMTPRFMKKLLKRLDRVEKGMSFEYGQGEFSISADGIGELVRSVKAVVAAAPTGLPFKVSAFRQAQDISGVSIRIADRSVTTENLRFLATHCNGFTHLHIFSEAIKSSQSGKDRLDDVIRGQLFVLLDHALGEYKVITEVGLIEFLPLSMAPAGHRPFSELPGLFGIYWDS